MLTALSSAMSTPSSIVGEQKSNGRSAARKRTFPFEAVFVLYLGGVFGCLRVQPKRFCIHSGDTGSMSATVE